MDVASTGTLMQALPNRRPGADVIERGGNKPGRLT